MSVALWSPPRGLRAIVEHSEIAFAKINLALHVRKRRGDGYHDIETLFAFAQHGDVLSAHLANALSLKIDGPFGSGLEPDESNLVLQTALLMQSHFGVSEGAVIRLEKQLPIASGIGGGSADAAAAGQTSGVASTPTPAAAPAAASGPVAPSARPVTAEAAAAGIRSDETVIELAPNQGAELKMDMAEGAKVRFTWRSSGGAVNFDTHADRPGVRYHGYGKGTDLQQSGELTAAFDGSHGWFWRNRTGETVTITVETEGAYTEIKRVV